MLNYGYDFIQLRICVSVTAFQAKYLRWSNPNEKERALRVTSSGQVTSLPVTSGGMTLGSLFLFQTVEDLAT